MEQRRVSGFVKKRQLTAFKAQTPLEDTEVKKDVRPVGKENALTMLMQSRKTMATQKVKRLKLSEAST